MSCPSAPVPSPMDNFAEILYQIVAPRAINKNVFYLDHKDTLSPGNFKKSENQWSPLK